MRVRFAQRPRTALLCLVVVALLAAACSGAGPDTESSSAPNEAAGRGEGAAASLQDRQVSVPSRAVNDWGVTSVERYLELDRRSTTDDPYGPLAGGMTVVRWPLLSQLIGASQAIVVGEVAEISPPYYNSVDGGFWYEPSSEAGRSILQDVTVAVESVLGDNAAITEGLADGTGSLVVTIAGGQIEISFDESVDPALLPEGFEPGRIYVEAVAPTERFAVGDRLLLFLYREAAPWYGAPIDPAMPWGTTTVAGCPAVPVGTKNAVSIVDWRPLGPDVQQVTLMDRTVTLDELETLAEEASLGHLLRDPRAPVGPGNMPGRSEPFNDPPRPCNKSSSPPTPVTEPPHTHPEYED